MIYSLAIRKRISLIYLENLVGNWQFSWSDFNYHLEIMHDNARIGKSNPTNVTNLSLPSLPSIQFYVGLIGFSANLILLLIILTSRKGLRDKSYLFISNIAFSDILTCVFVCVINTPNNVAIKVSPSFGKILCKLLYASFYFSFNSSTYSLAIISLHRLRMLEYPFSFRIETMVYRNAKILVVAIWVFSLMITVPNYYLSTITTLGLFCDIGYPYGLQFNRIYYTIAFIISSIIPTIIIIVSYFRIVKTLSSSIFNLPTFTIANSTEINAGSYYRSRSVVGFLIFTTSIYITLSLPFLIGFLIMSLLGLSFRTLLFENAQFRIYMIIATSSFISVTIFNPLLYLCCDRNIRLEIRKKSNWLYYFILTYVQ